MFGIDALSDQAAAGAFMWVLGSIVFLIPAFAITMQLLSRRRTPSWKTQTVR
jgi:putative membrane protein